MENLILNLKTDHASYGIPFKTKGLPMKKEDLVLNLNRIELEKALHNLIEKYI